MFIAFPLQRELPWQSSVGFTVEEKARLACEFGISREIVYQYNRSES